LTPDLNTLRATDVPAQERVIVFADSNVNHAPRDYLKRSIAEAEIETESQLELDFTVTLDKAKPDENMITPD
jgi:precorrin-4 methylase